MPYLLGKRRKLVAAKSQNGGLENTSVLYQQWNATTSDGQITFKIVSQPEIQHRARYQTEGSRGAIKDRAGTGFPTLRLEGYCRPTKIQIFIGNDLGKVMPHMFYQVCRVTGKNSNPCAEKKLDGTDVIELSFEPQLGNMTIVCDCVGILKERFADVEARFPKLKTWKNVKKKSTKCRLVFRTVVENSRGEPETLQVVSDVINCTQLPGTPEILKMSASGSSVDGGEELWIIGKNFLKDTKVIFSHSVVGKMEPLWTKFTEPDQDLFHQTHLITKIPPFYDMDIQEDVDVTVHIKCGDKLSDPAPFTYRPKPLQFTYSHAASGLTSDSVLPRGVAAPAVAIAQQFAQTGSVSVISAVEKVEADLAGQPRPTILEPLHDLHDHKFNDLHDHKNKKSRLDYVGKNARRTRSVPRPNLINEDTVFVSESSGTGVKVIYTSFAQNPMSPWKGRSPAPELVPSVIHNSPQPILPDPLQPPSTKRSFSFTDESSNSCFSHAENTRDTMVDENSHKNVQTNSDFTSSLTTDFSNVFRFKPTPSCEAPNPAVPYPTSPPTPKAEVEPPDQGCVILSPENTRDTTARPPSANDTVTEEDKELPNVSVKATNDEKATISISLPTSILRDQKHFQNVIETINNTLLRSSFNETEDGETEGKETTAFPPTSTVPTSTSSTTSIAPARASVTSPTNGSSWTSETTSPTQWTKSPPPGLATSPPLPTSHPVSVLSCRKRNFSSEPVADQPADIFTSQAATTNQFGETVVEEFKLNSSAVPGCTSVISETPVQQVQQQQQQVQQQVQQVQQQVVSPPAYEDTFKPMEVTPPPEGAPFMVYQESPQEKKWTAEFNEVMQTVIEDHKEAKAMEWSTPTTSEAKVSEPATTSAAGGGSGAAWETASTPAEPANGSKSQGMEWSLVKEAPAVPEPSTQFSAEPVTQFSTEPASQYNGQQSSQYISVDPPVPFPAEAPQPLKPTVQFLDPPAQPAVFDQFHSTQILTNTFPVVSNLPTVLETVAEQVPLTAFTESLVQIQGDPMLSETSAVIGAQKEIESAFRPGEEEPAMVAGQQWGHEWTYGSSS